MSLPVLSPEAVRYHPWSMSKAQLAKNCSYAFGLKYVDRVKGVVQEDSAAGRIGKAAHEALESVIKAKTVTALKRALVKATVDHKLTTTEIEELTSYTHNIASFHERLLRYVEKKNVTEMSVERRFGLRVDMRPTSFWGKELVGSSANKDERGRPRKDVFFRGVWDLVLTTHGHTIIIDHKSGAVPQKIEDAISQHDHQLKLYAVAALILFPQTLGVQSALHYLQSEEIIWEGSMRSAQQIREELFPWYIEYINQAAGAVAARRPSKGWYCAYCEYTDSCPLREVSCGR